MSLVSYLPRNPYASDRVSFGFPDGTVTLEKEVALEIDDKSVSWLRENSEEFKLATEQNIIIIKSNPPPIVVPPVAPPTPPVPPVVPPISTASTKTSK